MVRNKVSPAFRKKPLSFSISPMELIDLHEICKALKMDKNEFLIAMIKMFRRDGYRKELAKLYNEISDQKENYTKLEVFVREILEKKKDLMTYDKEQ